LSKNPKAVREFLRDYGTLNLIDIFDDPFDRVFLREPLKRRLVKRACKSF